MMTNKITFFLFCLLPLLACFDSTTLIGESSLVEVEELQLAMAKGEKFALIDLRKPEEYKKGHIPTAINVWRTDIVSKKYLYGGMMLEREEMALLLGKLGISPEIPIVIYDNKGNPDAARLWWMLDIYGHKNVALLNGGLKAWSETKKGIISLEEPVIIPTPYEFKQAINLNTFANINTVEAASCNSSSTALLDTRTLDEYEGKVQKKGAARAGNIPSCLFLDWVYSVNYDGNKKFKSKEELQALFEAKGITKDKQIITYCQSGVRSAHTTFVLTQILGYEKVKNYDGSWIEWSALR